MNEPVRIRDIIQARREVPFYNQIDLLAIEDDIVVGASGNMTVGFRVEGMNLMLKSRQEILSTVDFLRRTLGHLPEKTQYQFILKHKPGAGRALYDYRDAVKGGHPISEALIESKFNTLRSDRLFHDELYLFITKLHEEKQKLSGLSVVSNQKAAELSKEDFVRRKEELLTANSQLENAFSNLKLRTTPMKVKEFLTFFYFHLNPTRAANVRLGKVGNDPMQNITMRSSLLFSSPVVEREHFYQDGYFYQGINLLLPAENTDIQALGKMLDRIATPFDFMLSIHVPDNEKEIEKLRTRANVSKTFGFLGSSKNYDAVEKYHQIDSLITEIKSSTQKLAYYSVAFLIKDRRFQFLKQKHDQIMEAFPLLGSSEGIVDHMNHDRLFLSFLPGQAWMNPRKYLIQTDALANILPIQSEWAGTARPRILVKSRKQQLIKLDLFDDSLPARHGMIVGATGSGKSFATNYLLAHYLLENTTNQLIVIDVGNSYRRLAALFDGAYLDIDLGDQYAINPLLPKAELLKNGEVDSEGLAYLALVAEKLVKGTADEVLTNAHKRILEKAILKVYEAKEAPVLSDLQVVLRNYVLGDEEDAQRAAQFAKNLGIWTEGRYGKLLNRQGNISSAKRFVVFELGKLDAHPDLQAILFFVIRSAIWGKLYQKDIKKVIVIDEGWRFFNDDTSSRLIEDLYRTSRKFNGMVLSISQSPEDFLATKCANAIVSNSFTKYILMLNKGHEQLSQFDLNDSEIAETKSLVSKPGHFSEIFVKFGQSSTVARIEPTPLEYWIATTDPGDCEKESQERAQNPQSSTLDLLNHLAAKYPKGVRNHAQPG